MIFKNYKNGTFYRISNIGFPINRDGERSGFGSMVLTMNPNQQRSISSIKRYESSFNKNLYKRFYIDNMYNFKVGNRAIMRRDRIKNDKLYPTLEGFPDYITSGNIQNVYRSEYNIIKDLSRWMDLFFSNSEKIPIKNKCKLFVNLLKKIINDDKSISKYNKILFIDINEWVSMNKYIILSNPKLSSNPISLLVYIAERLPELANDLLDIRIMIANKNTSNTEMVIYNMKDFTKDNISKIKLNLRKFKNIIDSVDDKAEKEEEVAIAVNKFKNDILERTRYNLLGETPNNISEDEDIADTDEITSDEISDNVYDGIDEEISDIVSSTNDVSILDSEVVAKKVSDKVVSSRFISSFMPKRTDKELEKIAELTSNQNKILAKQNPTLDEVKRKTISTSIMGGYIDTINPNILESKFVNFDKDYVDKCLEFNIDNAVGALANASEKIFITNKEIIDSSTPLNLKRTYKYKLVDERGNKSTLEFDMPYVVDGSYVYLNGTKKNVRHQLLLKPLTKTGPATVQLVTAYNKVFIRRFGVSESNMIKIIAYLNKNTERYKAKSGNCSMKNGDIDLPVDMVGLSKYFTEFTIDTTKIILNLENLQKEYNRYGGKGSIPEIKGSIPIGIDLNTKKLIYCKRDEYTDTIYNLFPKHRREQISSSKRKSNKIVAKMKIMGKDIPMMLFMMYCDGFNKAMSKANMEYKFISKKEAKDYDPFEYGFISLEDGVIVWKKKPLRNELLMNGIEGLDLSSFTFDELESKDTYISLVTPMYPGKTNVFNALDNYRDFLLDPKTKEILRDFDYPDDLVSLLVIAAGMLSDNTYKLENSTHNTRIRNMDVLADLVYINVTDAYTKYRDTVYKKKPSKINFKKSAIIDQLLHPDVNMIEESSVLNPVLELEKQRAISFKGIRGIQKDRAMTLARRTYDDSMMGVLGISTPADANVGVMRQLTIEPRVTSTYGYIDPPDMNNLDELKSNNLFTVAELISPFGVLHDDPDRTAMDNCYVAFKPRELREHLARSYLLSIYSNVYVATRLYPNKIVILVGIVTRVRIEATTQPSIFFRLSYSKLVMRYAFMLI